LTIFLSVGNVAWDKGRAEFKKLELFLNNEYMDIVENIKDRREKQVA
jgi:hypothetical protein